MMVGVATAIIYGSLVTSAIAMKPTALVTGSTDGIGVTTAKNLAAKGYHVLVHGRDENRIQSAVTEIKRFSGQPNVLPLPAQEISTVAGCERLASNVESFCKKNDLGLTILMNNAGVFAEEHQITPDGLELTFAVNVMAPFVVTSLLLPTLLSQPKSRIVTASSISQCQSIRSWDDLHYMNRPFSSHASYSESKLFDTMLTYEFAERLARFGTDRITANCLDPGTVNTKMLLAGWGRCGIDVRDALDQTWLCTSEEVQGVSGQYFNYRTPSRGGSAAYDKSQRDRLWEILSELSPKSSEMWKFEFAGSDVPK